MGFRAIPTIYRKEMTDMLRDRRTLISMVVVPVAAIPLLMFVMGKFVASAEKKAGEESATIAVQNAERLPGLLNALAGAGFKLVSKSDLKAAVQKKEIAVGVEPVELERGAKEVRIYADLTRPGSQMAATNVRAALDRFKENSLKLRLLALGVPEEEATPFTVRRINIAPEKKMAGYIWGMIFGYAVVLLMFTGGMYPAIDLTAGEKERRTLEVLLSSPAGRDELILGKILATTTAVFLTALLSVASLIAGLRVMNFGKVRDFRNVFGAMPLELGTVALVLALLLPTAVMGASLMVAISLFAKSFKEAQSYLTPLVMAVVFPLIAGMIPGLQLTPALALIPLFNTCQLTKEIFMGEYSRAAMAVTLVANLVFAAAAFLAAVRVFKSERVLFRT